MMAEENCLLKNTLNMLAHCMQKNVNWVAGCVHSAMQQASELEKEQELEELKGHIEAEAMPNTHPPA